MNKKIIIVVAIIAIIFFIFKIIPMLGSDTEKIRKVIIEAKQATEKKDLMKCISFVSKDYLDKHGYGKSELLFIVKHAFAEYDDILIIIENMKIDVEGSSKAKAHILASGQSRRKTGTKFIYDLDSDRVEFNIIFKKEGNNWKVIELDFLQPEDFLQFLKGL